jgi:hypothetical protein
MFRYHRSPLNNNKKKQRLRKANRCLNQFKPKRKLRKKLQLKKNLLQIKLSNRLFRNSLLKLNLLRLMLQALHSVMTMSYC